MNKEAQKVYLVCARYKYDEADYPIFGVSLDKTEAEKILNRVNEESPYDYLYLTIKEIELNKYHRYGA